MITLTVNGISYQYPQVDDEDWGNQATLWASSVSDVLLCMRKPTLPTADAGVVRLGNGDAIEWRNFLNSANAKLYLDVDDKLYIKVGSNPAIDLTANAAGNVTGPVSSTDNALSRYDGTTGQVIQDSGAILDDSNNLSGLASVDATTVKQGGTALTDLFIDIIGSSTDHGIARWDGTTGKQLEDSGITIDDSNNMAIPGDATVTGNLSANGNVTLGDAAGDSITINAATSVSVPAAFGNKCIDVSTRATGASVGIRGVAIATNQASASGSSATYVDVTNATITITTSGRPVIITAVSTDATGPGFLAVSKTAAGTAQANIKLVRGVTDIGAYDIETASSNATDLTINFPPSSLLFLDAVAAGTYTYKLQIRLTNGTSYSVGGFKLIAYEL